MNRCQILRPVMSCLALGPTLVLAQVVSFTADAQPVPELISAINAEFSTSYSAAWSLRSDIVCVQVTDVPLSELLQKIADVTASSWVDRGGTLTLTPSAGLRAAERRTEIESRKSDFKRQLERNSRVWENAGIDPRIVEHLPLYAIAAQPAWTVEVYAVSPTRAQKRLDRSLPNLVGTEWIKSPPKGKSQTAVTVGRYEDLHLVSRNMGARVQLSLEATDANGAVISRTFIALRPSLGNGGSVKVEGVDESKVVALDPVRRAFAKLWSAPSQARDSDETLVVAKYLSIDPSLRAGVDKLVSGSPKVEPLSVFVSTVLNEATRIEGRDLVALLPDSAILLGNYIAQVPQIEAPGALAYLQGSIMRSRDEGEWTLMTPLLPAQSRSDRMDRGDLRSLVLDVRNTGGLDPIALISVLPRNAVTRTDLMQGLLEYYDVGVAGAAAASFTREFSTFKALSTVRTAVLQAAMSGTVVTINQPSAAIRNSVRTDILSRRLPVSRVVETSVAALYAKAITLSTSSIPEPFQKGTMPRQMMVSPPIEVTDLLSNGLSALELQIYPKITQMIQGRHVARGFMQRTSLDKMAYAAANAEHGRTDRRTDGLLICEEFMPIQRHYWSITYRLPDGMIATTLISWIDPDVRGDWRSFESLGPAFMEQYNRSYRAAQQKIRLIEQKGGPTAVKKAVGKRIPPPAL